MPTTTPFDQVIADIKDMQDSFSQPQCAVKKPFLEYPTDGDPPKLNFTIPQTTTFTTYGHILKSVPYAYFKAFTKVAPVNNYYEMVKTMNTEQAVQLFHPNVAASSAYMGQFIPAAASNIRNAGGVVNQVSAYNSGASTPNAGFASAAHLSPGSASPTSAEPTTLAAAIKGSPAAYMNVSASPAMMVQATPAPDPRATQFANYAMQGLRPMLIKRILGTGQVTKYIAQPPIPVPRITIIEEYTTSSYLGDYGAGRVVKTFTLLPGEKTTMSVRTYKDKVTTYEKAQNVIDSFSESSATELDTLLQHEQGDMSSSADTSGGSGSSYATTTDSKNSSKSWGISGSLNFGIGSIGGGYGQSQSEMQTSGTGFNNTYNYNHSAARQSNVNALSSAIDKHVQQSNANRLIDVNTSTSDVSSSGEEDVTVRELKNVNLNRVLNFTFRQLLQEYTTITYLSNLKFAYSNGYPESYTVVDMNNLVNMLTDIIDEAGHPGAINEVLCMLLQPYCAVLNWKDSPKQFVKSFTVNYTDCLHLGVCQPYSETFYRKDPDLSDKYDVDPLHLDFNGVILSVQKQTLRTSSLIGDALLGAGDALDCFNQNAQNASNQADYIRNMQAMQNLEDSIQTTGNNNIFAQKQQDAMDQQKTVISGVASGDVNAVTAADKYKKVYGDCCDVPQSCCGGCGCDGDTPPAP